MNRLIGLINDGLLAVGVLLGPGLWLAGIACAYTAWQPGIPNEEIAELLFASFVFLSWALWGIVSGPRRIRLWWFLLSSLLNMLGGFAELVSNEPNHYPVGALFLAYSLWQFFVYRRPRPRPAA